MWRGIIAAILGLWAGLAAAQTVEVRAGEHDGFTRLVFNLPLRVGYELTRTDGQAELRFERPGLRLDTSAVFERVPRTRLTGIAARPEQGVVLLSLACPCELETFWFAQSSLVVDIREATEPAQESAANEPDSEDRVLDPLPAIKKRPSAAADLVTVALDRRLAAPESEDLGAAAVLVESRDRLVKEFSRAASQGLLSPRRSMPGRQTPANSVPLPSKDANNVPETLSPARDAGRNIQLHAETSVDRDMRAILTSGLGPMTTDSCLAPGLVDVASWGTEAPFSRQVAPLRAKLVGEFDTPDRATVTALARLYIYFGFGAETAQLLRQFPGAAADENLLRDLAAIVENGDSGPNSALAGQMDCAPMTTVWSALSYPALPTNVPLDDDALLRGFAGLPAHLRSHLGPILARRLLEAGYARESARVRRIVNRSETTRSPEARLLEAEVALSDGQAEAAERQLDTLVAGNDEPSAEALLKLIETRLKRDGGISYEMADLAGAYAVEYRRDTLGPELARAYLSALAASGAFDRAFAEMPEIVKAQPDMESDIRASFLSLLTARAGDFEFLRYALTQTAEAGAIDPETANAAAGRLLSLGFLGGAGAFLGMEATGPAGRARKLLRAEIALGRSRPREAEAELLGVTGEKARLLRARARSMAGEHDAAGALFAAAGRPEKARQEAWLGQDWETLANTADPAKAPIAALKLARQAQSAEPAEGSLARNTALIEDSNAVREAVGRLLEGHPPPPSE